MIWFHWTAWNAKALIIYWSQLNDSAAWCIWDHHHGSLQAGARMTAVIDHNFTILLHRLCGYSHGSISCFSPNGDCASTTFVSVQINRLLLVILCFRLHTLYLISMPDSSVKTKQTLKSKSQTNWNLELRLNAYQSSMRFFWTLN